MKNCKVELMNQKSREFEIILKKAKILGKLNSQNDVITNWWIVVKTEESQEAESVRDLF